MSRLISVIYEDFGPFPFWGLWDDFACHYMVSDARLTKDDTIIIHGGEDISPAMYGDKVGKYTGAQAYLSARDRREKEFIEEAKRVGASVIGICRGAQIMCAMSGGSLYQHVENHGSKHVVTDAEGNEFYTNSCHHQMLDIRGSDGVLLAWLPKPISDVHWKYDHTEDLDKEPEAVYFPNMRGLAIQWHPEWMSETSPATKWLENKYKELIHVKEQVLS